MLYHIRSCVLMFVSVLLLSLCRVTKPTIFPRQKELVINEGDTLKIMCTGNILIKFNYPVTTGTINTSGVTLKTNLNESDFMLILQRVAVFGDTGWYCCNKIYEANDCNYSNDYEDSEQNRLYVYVKSDRNFFVEYPPFNPIETCADKNVVIPCRPTSPDLVVDFETENEDELKNKTSFDPKNGFTIKNVKIRDSGKISCIIEEDNYKQVVNYTLHVEKNPYLPEPFIDSNFLLFMPGEDLRFNCTMEIDNNTKYEFGWEEYPEMDLRNNSRKSIQLFRETIGANRVLITSQMTIFNITDKDARPYKCVIKTACTYKSSTKHLRLLAKPTIVNLFTPYSVLNEKVQFICETLGTPQPNISLTYHKYPNYPLLTNSTEMKEMSPIKKDLFLSYASINIRIIETLGVLTCESCNDLGCDKSIKVIPVPGGVGPLNIVMPKQPITRGDKVELICGAFIYKYTRELTWRNENDQPIEEISASGKIKITRDETPLTYLSVLTIHQAQQSDAQNYTCYGQVKSADDVLPVSTSYKLVVEEPVPPYFHMTNMNETVMRNIDVIPDNPKTEVLKCMADGLPNPEITWYKNGELLEENARYKFTNNYQELNINFISQLESGIYSCRARNRVGTKEVFQEIKVHKERNKGYIIFTTSIVILVIVLLILSAFFIRKVRLEKKMAKELIEAGLMNFETGALECLNSDLTVDEQVEFLPYDKKWEFPRDRLKLGKQLGRGNFGVVMKAEAQRICSPELVTTVAVKMVRRTTDLTYVRPLANELKIMVHLGKHLNVVNLLGACTKNISKRELLVIVEYCRFGDLHNYLLRHRTDFIDQIDPNTRKLNNTIGLDTRTVNVSNNHSPNANSSIDTLQYFRPTSSDSQEILSPNGDCILSSNSSQPDRGSNYDDDCTDHNLKPICTQDLLSWAFQVARGMEYLSQRKVLHGDLAARNILLAEDNIVKICDFGLAKDVYKNGKYKKQGDDPLPVKWMAIESIKDRIFSTQSDIWSYGIVLWEFFTLAETPYDGMKVEEQYQKLIAGYRLKQPKYAMPEIYDIMLQCWQAKPVMRPRFTQLVTSIGDLLNESVKSHYMNLNVPYMEMNKVELESGKDDYLMMMSAPDHEVLSSLYVNSSSEDSEAIPLIPINLSCQMDEIRHIQPRPQDHSHFEFLSPTPVSEEAVVHSLMLKQEFDPYLEPINVQERRVKFARQKQAMKDRMTDRSIDPNDRPVD